MFKEEEERLKYEQLELEKEVKSSETLQQTLHKQQREIQIEKNELRRMQDEVKGIEEERKQIQKLEKDLHIQRAQMEKKISEHEERYKKMMANFEKERKMLQ